VVKVTLSLWKDESQGWTGAKAMMSDVGFMRALQEYKKDPSAPNPSLYIAM